MSALAQTVEAPVAAPPERVWHICTDASHEGGKCRPGCVAYCGTVYRGGGRKPRSRDGVPSIDVCIACQCTKDGF